MSNEENAQCKDSRYDPVFDRVWKEHSAPFKKVEWVPKGTEGAKQLRGKMYECND